VLARIYEQGVRDLVDGSTLEDRLDRRTQASEPSVEEIVLEVAAGVFGLRLCSACVLHGWHPKPGGNVRGQLHLSGQACGLS
jgi:hypothetical protein